MAYDLEEQESLAQIKAWWDKWGTLILSIVTVVCLCSAGYQGWRWWKMKEASDAAVLYAQMVQSENTKQVDRVQAIAKRLQDDYASTVYAGMGTMLAARSAEANGKDAEAVKLLTDLVNSGRYPEINAIASVRLAGLLLDQGKYDQALSTLDKIKDTKGQLVLINDRKGDIYMAMGDTAKAKASWEDALRNANPENPLVNIIEVKLNSLPKKA